MLSLEPANKEAASELKSVKDLLAKEEQQYNKEDENRLDVNNKQNSSSVNQAAKSQAPVLEKKADVFLQQVKSEKKSTSDDKQHVKRDISKDTTPQDSTQSSEPPQEAKSTASVITGASAKQSSELPPSSAPLKTPALPAIIPVAVPEVAPKHYYEFERSWNSLKDDTKACYKYFKVMRDQ